VTERRGGDAGDYKCENIRKDRPQSGEDIGSLYYILIAKLNV